VKSRLLLDVVVREGSAVLKLLTGEDESLLIGWDALFVLDLGLDVFDGVGGLDFEGDRFSGEGFHENLHTTSESEYQVEGGLLLDVVVAQSSTVFKLLAGKNQSLLIWRDALFVLDLGFDVFDGVGRLDLEGDRFSGEGFHENLHTSSKSEDQMEGGLLLDVVVAQSSSVLELLAGEDESLLIGRDAFFVLDFGLDVLDGVGGFDL